MKNLLLKVKRKIKLGSRGRRKKLSGLSLFQMRRKSKGSSVKRVTMKNGVILFAILGCGVLLLVWSALCIYKSFSLELQTAYKDERLEKEREWRGEDRINILFVGMDQQEGEFGFSDALCVVMIDSQDQSIGIFNINPDTHVYISKYKKYVKLRNLYNFGVFKGDDAPIQLLLEGVKTLLSVEMSRYIIIDEVGIIKLVDILKGVHVSNSSLFEDRDIQTEGENFQLNKGEHRLGGGDLLNFLRSDDDGVEKKYRRQIEGLEGFLRRSTSYMALIRMPSFLDTVSSEIKTNLSKQELIRLSIKVLRFKEVKSAFMSLSSLEEREVATGTRYFPILDKLDQDIQKIFIDSRIGREQARVEVFNATSIQGLASFRARWLRNIGVDIIRVGDSSLVFEKTTVFSRETGKYTHTIEAVKKSFVEEIEVREGELPDFVCTGDVVVVLGDNIKEN